MRAYVKPELFYENFELAQNIAACDVSYKVNGQVTYADMNTCYASHPNLGDYGIYLFTNNANCDSAALDDFCIEVSASHVTTWKS